jgi:pimeloyl-ACP methyl ester carboxylesterase
MLQLPEVLAVPVDRIAVADGNAVASDNRNIAAQEVFRVLAWRSRNGDAQAPAIVLAHANGFCADLWRSIATELSADYDVFAFDARGHGGTRAGTTFKDLRWEVLHADFNALITALAERGHLRAPVIAVGHSMGGMTAVCAAAKVPQNFAQLILLDPLVWWPEMAHKRRSQENKGRMAQGARRRRAWFASREVARHSWRPRDTFCAWDEDVFSAYLDYGLVADGEGVSLACAPIAEATLFEAHWDEDMRELARAIQCGGRVVHASNGHFPKVFHTELAELVPGFECVEFRGSHFFPMEQPDATYEVIRAAIADA